MPNQKGPTGKMMDKDEWNERMEEEKKKCKERDAQKKENTRN